MVYFTLETKKHEQTGYLDFDGDHRNVIPG